MCRNTPSLPPDTRHKSRTLDRQRSKNVTTFADTFIVDGKETNAGKDHIDTTEDTAASNTTQNTTATIEYPNTATDEGFNIDPDPAQPDTEDTIFTIDTPQVDKIDDGKAIAGTSGSGYTQTIAQFYPDTVFPPLSCSKTFHSAYPQILTNYSTTRTASRRLWPTTKSL